MIVIRINLLNYNNKEVIRKIVVIRIWSGQTHIQFLWLILTKIFWTNHNKKDNWLQWILNIHQYHQIYYYKINILIYWTLSNLNQIYLNLRLILSLTFLKFLTFCSILLICIKKWWIFKCNKTGLQIIMMKINLNKK